MSAEPPTSEHKPEPEDDKTNRAIRGGIVGLVLFGVLLAIAFGKAVANGDYFGECDHAAHEQCRIIHVLGVVMHRDVPVETETTTSTATTSANTETTTAAPPREYTSPCHLYIRRHNAMVEMLGPEAAGNCAHFVGAAGQTPWTTEAQNPSESPSVVCEVQNIRQEHATVTDTGSQEYGKEACKQLSGEGFG